MQWSQASGPAEDGARAAVQQARPEAPAGKGGTGRARIEIGEVDSAAVETSVAVALYVDGRMLWSGQATPCGREKWRIELTLRDGAVVAAAPIGDGSFTPVAGECLPMGLVGVRFEDLEDGVSIGVMVAK